MDRLAASEFGTLPFNSMKTNQHRIPLITADGNGEERAAQVRHIQERLDRLHRVHEQITGEVKQLTDDVRTLNQERAAPTPPEKEPN